MAQRNGLSRGLRVRALKGDGKGVEYVSLFVKRRVSSMPEELKNVGEEYQRLSKEGFDAVTRSFGEMNKGFQALAAEMTDYSKRTFEDVFRAWEQLLSAKSVEQMIDIQSQYAKKAYDTHMSEMSKLGDIYVAIARNASKPVEQATARTARKVE
jgi:phasin family protein